LFTKIEQRHAHGQIAWQFRHAIQEVVVPWAVLIAVSAGVSLFTWRSCAAFFGSFSSSF
jgi:hypothetical protein